MNEEEIQNNLQQQEGLQPLPVAGFIVEENNDEQPETIQPLEVHHHPHVEKKSFKEYILEGLMIFFAVTMGFIAENIRENITKHEKEHRLMEMLVEDLKHDTAQINNAINTYLYRVYKFDTLRTGIIKATKENLSNDECRKMYYIFRGYGGIGNLYFSVVRALTMLEKEGFELIRKQNVTDSILQYKEVNSKIEGQIDLITKNQDNANTYAIQIFDIELLNDYVDLFKAKEILSSTKNFKLLTNKTELLKPYAFCLFKTRSAMYNFTIFLAQKESTAERLIALIEKEYHLKHE